MSERDWKRKSREKKTYKLSRMREKNRERDRERRREQERWDTEGLQERASRHGSQRVCWPPAVMLAQHQQLDGQLATRTEPAGGASLAHNLSSLTHTQVRAHIHTGTHTRIHANINTHTSAHAKNPHTYTKARRHTSLRMH